MKTEPDDLERAEIDRLEAEARLLRDRVADAESKGSKAAGGLPQSARGCGSCREKDEECPRDLGREGQRRRYRQRA